MMSKDRVILIENQKTQFEDIRTRLCQHYTVFPEEADFIKIADLARISLTQRYDHASHEPGIRRENALKELVKYINTKKIDLIIIDHVLVGHQPSENGIHLARKLLDQKIEQPIIFMSRTERNKESVKKDLNMMCLSDTPWIEKGYAGQGIGDPWYFEKNIVAKIKDCIGESLNSMLDTLVTSGLGADYTDDINKLRGKSFTPKQKNRLKKFCSENFATKTSSDIQTLIKDLQNET